MIKVLLFPAWVLYNILSFFSKNNRYETVYYNLNDFSKIGGKSLWYEFALTFWILVILLPILGYLLTTFFLQI